MSTRSLRARLDRLARFLKVDDVVDKNEDRTQEYTIDSELAQALSEASNRMNSLERRVKRWSQKPLTAEEEAEERLLEETISAMAMRAVLPVPYGRDEAIRDRNRKNALRRRRISGAEAIQLAAREIAYSYQSPEGRAWKRIAELETLMRKGRKTTAQIDEVLRLHSEYPPLPPDQDEPSWRSLQAYRKVGIESLREQRRQLEEAEKKYRAYKLASGTLKAK